MYNYKEVKAAIERDGLEKELAYFDENVDLSNESQVRAYEKVTKVRRNKLAKIFNKFPEIRTKTLDEVLGRA